MVALILTLILLQYASGVTADNCNNYAKRAEYSVLMIKAECGKKNCISLSSQTKIKAYGNDLKKWNTYIKKLKCKQKRVDMPATPRTCTKCDDLEARAGTIIGEARLALFRKTCVTRGDLIKVQTYEKSYDTCKKEFARLRCRQNMGKLEKDNCCTYEPKLGDGVKLFKKDLQTFVACINSNVHVRLTQYQFDALVSVAYNYGCGGFTGLRLLKYVNHNNFKAASAIFTRLDNPSRNAVARKLFDGKDVASQCSSVSTYFPTEKSCPGKPPPPRRKPPPPPSGCSVSSVLYNKTRPVPVVPYCDVVFAVPEWSQTSNATKGIRTVNQCKDDTNCRCFKCLAGKCTYGITRFCLVANHPSSIAGCYNGGDAFGHICHGNANTIYIREYQVECLGKNYPQYYLYNNSSSMYVPRWNNLECAIYNQGGCKLTCSPC